MIQLIQSDTHSRVDQCMFEIHRHANPINNLHICTSAYLHIKFNPYF